MSWWLARLVLASRHSCVVLNLLEEPTSGEIIVDGVKITDPHVNLNVLRQTIGMVFQQFNLFPNLSVIDNIKLAPKKLRKFSDQKSDKIGAKFIGRCWAIRQSGRFAE